MLLSKLRCSIFLVTNLFVSKAVADFYIYTFEVHRKDGDSLYGWQFFNTPPTCAEIELAEVTTSRVKLRGSPYNLRSIEWANKMGHWKVSKHHAYAPVYTLLDVGGYQRGWCFSNTSSSWECDWGPGFGLGRSVIFCNSDLNADSVYGKGLWVGSD